MVNDDGSGQGSLTIKALSEAAAEASDQNQSKKGSLSSAKSFGSTPSTRIDDSPSPSIGIVAACLLEVEPENE